MAWGRKTTAAQTPAWSHDDYHKAFAGKLKEQIEQGVAPWQKPWGSSHKCVHDSAPSRSATPWKEAADVLVPANQR